jgi:type I restriction enzyme, S subunit
MSNQGWQTKTLGEILVKTVTVNPLLAPEVDFDYIDVSSVSNESFQIEETQRLKGKDAPSRARKQVRTNDLIFATIRPTLRRIAVVPEKFDNQICSTGYFVLRPQPLIYYRFMYYWLFSAEFMGQMEVLQKGASYPAVTDAEVRAQKIPFPPLPEQHRIVAILDTAFDHITTAKANCEANLLNARAIFESHLQAVFTQRGDGWERTTLGKATGGIYTGPFGSLLHKSDYVANGIPLVNPAHITEVGIEPDSLKTVSEETARRLKSYIMRKGDIVIARRGEMGRCALVTETENGWLCGTGSFYIKPSNRCDTRYLVRFLRSDSCKTKLERIAGGTVMPNLSNTALSNLPIDLPNLQQQASIVEGIDNLHAETQRLESLYQRKLQALDDLKKSLLHQAFSGLL